MFGQNERKLPAYENMKHIEPGDLIFSYHGQKIANYGIATDRAIPAPKPTEFGKTGSYWADAGWCVRVEWSPLEPVERDRVAAGVERYFRRLENPFTVSGTVKQAYLFQISKGAADFILGLGKHAIDQAEYRAMELKPAYYAAETTFDDMIEKSLLQRTDIAQTEKESIVQARRGQGLYRENLCQIERHCRLTGVDDPRLLVASHIKPWRSCVSTFEKLDGNNGLLLTPTMDKLFDRRYMTFEDDGRAVLSEKIAPETYERVGIHPDRPIFVGPFRPQQQQYLRYHRGIFLG